MADSNAPNLDSSYVWSLITQLATIQDASDQMSSFMTSFECADGDLLVEKMGPFVKDDKAIKEVTESFLAEYGDIFWPPAGAGKEQKFKWSTDKAKISDMVGDIFAEKFRLYKQHLEKDSEAGSQETTPAPEAMEEGNSTPAMADAIRVSRAAPDDLPDDSEPSNGHMDDEIMEDAPITEPKFEPSTNGTEEINSIRLLTNRSRTDTAASSASKFEESEATNAKTSRSPVETITRDAVDDANKPISFANEDAFRQGILDAIERQQKLGQGVVGAIQFVRTTLNETAIREAVPSAQSSKSTGTVRLIQINEKTMAWVYQKHDGTCVWVKPYKGKVINGVVRYSGWVGVDSVFTDYPVTYGMLSRNPETPSGRQYRDDYATASASRGGRFAMNPAERKILKVKLRQGGTMPVGGTPPYIETPGTFSWPRYIHSDSCAMERAKAAIRNGKLTQPPCGYCVDGGFECILTDRGRTCAYCIATNRSATNCEGSRNIGNAEYAHSASGAYADSSTFDPHNPVLTHSGRISKRPTRDSYIDESDSPVSSAEPDSSNNPQPPRRHYVMPAEHPHSLKRARPAMEHEYEGSPHPPPPPPPSAAHRGTSLHHGTAYVGRPHGVNSLPHPSHPSHPHASHASHGSHAIPSSSSVPPPPEIFFHFSLSDPAAAPKEVRARDLPSVHAFFDAAKRAFKLLGNTTINTKLAGGAPGGGGGEGAHGDMAFSAVDVSWPERRMIVEWGDERDWERMMEVLGRARGNRHGEVEVGVRCLMRA